MHLQSLLLAASYAASATAVRCGNERIDYTADISRLDSRQTTPSNETTYSVDLHIHIVSTNANASLITDSAVTQQVRPPSYFPTIPNNTDTYSPDPSPAGQFPNSWLQSNQPKHLSHN